MNNNTKINTSKGKMYFTIVAIASFLLMAFTIHSNVNSSMNSYASLFDGTKNVDDVGQSLECIIVVVGCDGTGSVGSSGDVIIGSNNGNNPPPPPPSEPLTCVECFENALSAEQIQVLLQAVFHSSLEDFCSALTGIGEDGFTEYLISIGLSEPQAEALIDCLKKAGIPFFQ
jgi:hypothetical protein